LLDGERGQERRCAAAKKEAEEERLEEKEFPASNKGPAIESAAA